MFAKPEFDFNTPNVSSSTDYDTLSGGFVNRTKVGSTAIGPPRFLTLDEYLAESRKKAMMIISVNVHSQKNL